MSKLIRWGVVTAGRIAHQFADDLADIENCSITAVYSRTRETAERFAEKYGVSSIYDTVEGLVTSGDIDCVYIASPHSFHESHALAAISAKLPVLCEKPLALNAGSAAALAQRATATRVLLMEGMWTYFLPAHQTAMRWLESGVIGPLIHIKVDFGYPQLPFSPDRREYNKSLGGGAMWEMGIYPVALVWDVMRAQPKSVHTIQRNAPNGVEDDLASILEFESVTASIGTSFRCKLENAAYLIGRDGYIEIPDFWRCREAKLYELETLIEHFVDDRTSNGFEFEALSFMEDIRQGKTEPSRVSHEDSIAFQKMMETIIHNANT